MTIATDFEKIFKVHNKLYIGLPGLATDVQTIRDTLKFKMNLYKLREEREIKPETFGHLVSGMLYEKRFGPYFVEPVIAGLDKDNKPYVCAMDLIGAPVFTDDFVVGGTCTSNLYGTCETFYKKD